MNIAIIGAGIAGLASAWLLDADHRITLFERNDFLGGHARTVHFEHQGKKAYANPAFGYIAPRMYPHFIRLLDLLNVPRHPSPTSVTVHSSASGESVFITPTLSPLRLAPVVIPKHLLRLLAVQRLTSAARILDDHDDWNTTLEQFIEAQPLSAFMKNQLLYPWIAALSGVSISETKGFSARAALKYPVHVQPESVLRPFELQELVGGVSAYVQPLIATLRNSTIRSSVDLQPLRKQGDHFILTDSAGNSETFDQVILAAPAFESLKLVGDLPDSDRLTAILRRFPYAQTRIAVHSDPRLMPAKRADWSVYNALYDGGDTCEGTIWSQRSGEIDYFKSWLTFNPITPRDIHAEFQFHHPIMTPDYHRAQADLAALQGQGKLWFAGSYTLDVDSHESGIRSAMALARRLNPQSANLARIENQ